jgi:uncharacterized protein with HEPN domain
MFDRQLALEILRQIEEAADKILDRFQPIGQVTDFTDTPAGNEKMDAICMLLIVVGESLKNFDKVTAGAILARYPQVEWKKAMGMRDIITHHYADINAEAIFNTCRDKIPLLGQTVKKISKDLNR